MGPARITVEVLLFLLTIIHLITIILNIVSQEVFPSMVQKAESLSILEVMKICSVIFQFEQASEQFYRYGGIVTNS